MNIDVFGLTKNYGVHRVLHDVTFAVTSGESFAIIGPNGAGKTTLFKVLTGELSANGGKILYSGNDVTAMPANLRVQAGVGRTFQICRVFFDFSVLENAVVAIEQRNRNLGIRSGAWYAFKPSHTVLEEACERLAEVGLVESRFVQARNLSYGDRKRLELALALALEPSVLMLDEPTAGMAAPDRGRTVELIHRIREGRSVTLLLTEHDMGVVFGLAQRIMVLNYGEVVAIGEPQTIRLDPLVAEIYLGKEAHSAGG
jgi:branched-chain amino acid transport system ATP-binding protein